MVIALYWRGGHCCPMYCDLFKMFCASPNIGITRTWICQLNFAQGPIFSGLWFFNEPEISDLGPPAESPSQRTCAQDFYVLKKSIKRSRVWTREPWISRRANYPETTDATRLWLHVNDEIHNDHIEVLINCENVFVKMPRGWREYNLCGIFTNIFSWLIRSKCLLVYFTGDMSL